MAWYPGKLNGAGPEPANCDGSVQRDDGAERDTKADELVEDTV